MADGSNTVHIDAPQLLTRRQRLRDGAITAFMWMLYSYLWAPLISLIAWLLGFEFAYNVMVRSGGIQGLYDLLGPFSLVVGLIILIILGWSFVNRKRFAGIDRRKGAEPVSDGTLANYFGVDKAELERARGLRVSRIAVGAEGEVEAIEDLEDEAHLRGSRSRNARSQMSKPNMSAM